MGGPLPRGAEVNSALAQMAEEYLVYGRNILYNENIKESEEEIPMKKMIAKEEAGVDVSHIATTTEDNLPVDFRPL